jgi:hypothetical protein
MRVTPFTILTPHHALVPKNGTLSELKQELRQFEELEELQQLIRLGPKACLGIHTTTLV